MLSKKRQILFEVLGHRTQASRSPERVSEAPAPRRRTTGRRREAPMRRRGPLWLGLTAVVLVTVLFAVYRIRRPGNVTTPALQTNTGEARQPEAPEAEQPAAHVFSVCVWAKEYKNATDCKLAHEKVREIVDFLGYHADPGFRDVGGMNHKGKEPNTGIYRIYVGSGMCRSELAALKDKLMALPWKGGRPFQNASIMMVERAAPSGSKEASDER